jgi:hypothetical protein
MKATVAEEIGENPAPDLETAATAFTAKLTAVGGAAGFGGRRGSGGGFGAPGGAPPAPSFTRVQGSLVSQLNTLDSGDMAPNEPMLKAFQVLDGELKTVITNWNALNAKDLVAFNAVLAKYNLKTIPAAPLALAGPR